MSKKVLRTELTGEEMMDKNIIARVSTSEYLAIMNAYTTRKAELINEIHPFSLNDYFREIIFQKLGIALVYPEKVTTAAKV